MYCLKYFNDLQLLLILQNQSMTYSQSLIFKYLQKNLRINHHRQINHHLWYSENLKHALKFCKVSQLMDQSHQLYLLYFESLILQLSFLFLEVLRNSIFYKFLLSLIIFIWYYFVFIGKILNIDYKFSPTFKSEETSWDLQCQHFRYFYYHHSHRTWKQVWGGFLVPSNCLKNIFILQQLRIE